MSEALPNLWELGLVNPRRAHPLVAAIQKLLRVPAIVRLVVRRFTIVACHRVMPIGNIKPARVASVPIVETLCHVGVWGIDAVCRWHAPNLRYTLAAACVRHHCTVATCGVVPVATVAPTSTTAVTGATSAITRVSPATSLGETPCEPSTLSERLEKGYMHCGDRGYLHHRALLGYVRNVDGWCGGLDSRPTSTEGKSCHLLHDGCLVGRQRLDGGQDIG